MTWYKITMTTFLIFPKTEVHLFYKDSSVFSIVSRSLKRGSDETFVMPGLKKLGALQRIQIQQKYLSWLLKWKLIKVTVMKPGWTGTQLDRSNTQSWVHFGLNLIYKVKGLYYRLVTNLLSINQLLLHPSIHSFVHYSFFHLIVIFSFFFNIHIFLYSFIHHTLFLFPSTHLPSL